MTQENKYKVEIQIRVPPTDEKKYTHWDTIFSQGFGDINIATVVGLLNGQLVAIPANEAFRRSKEG